MRMGWANNIEIYVRKSAEWEMRRKMFVGLRSRPLAEVGLGILNICFPLPQSFFLLFS